MKWLSNSLRISTVSSQVPSDKLKKNPKILRSLALHLHFLNLQLLVVITLLVMNSGFLSASKAYHIVGLFSSLSISTSTSTCTSISISVSVSISISAIACDHSLCTIKLQITLSAG